MKPKLLLWTNRCPTEPGWYWWRDQDKNGTCTLIELWEMDEDGVLRTGDPDYRESAEGVLDRNPACQWSSLPIPLPAPMRLCATCGEELRPTLGGRKPRAKNCARCRGKAWREREAAVSEGLTPGGRP